MILPRPAIITRRALVTGAAALAMAPNDLRAANAAGWNPSDKSANITLASSPYFGPNATASNTATSGHRGIRSAWSASTGKWMVSLSYKSLANSGNDGHSVSFAIANGAASLSSKMGTTNDAWAITDYDGLHGSATPLFQSNGDGFFFPNPESLVPYTGSTYWFALNLDASPKRAHFRILSFASAAGNNAVNDDTGWRDWTDTASDPTNNASGTDISDLGTPVYIGGSCDFLTTPSTIILNMGGWPLLTDFVAYPTGYSSPDANYPYTMPAGVFTISSRSHPANVTLSQNNMRASLTTFTGANTINYSSIFPSGSKTLHSFVWDKVWGRNIFVAHALCRNDSGYSEANSSLWYNSGATTNLGGVTWPSYNAGDATYMAVDRSNNRVWGSLDCITWYGNGGASPNPATNTNGADISALPALATMAPGAFLDGDYYLAATFNAGRTPDPVTIPSGFCWLEGCAAPRFRGQIIN